MCAGGIKVVFARVGSRLRLRYHPRHLAQPIPRTLLVFTHAGCRIGRAQPSGDQTPPIKSRWSPYSVRCRKGVRCIRAAGADLLDDWE